MSCATALTGIRVPDFSKCWPDPYAPGTWATWSQLLRMSDRDDWVDCTAAGISCSPVHTLGAMAAHPHTAASGLLQTYEHPAYGLLKTVSQPLKFHGERQGISRPPPLLGQHTREVLFEAG